MLVNLSTGSSCEILHGPATENFYEVLLLEGNRLSPSAVIAKRSFVLKNNLRFNEDQNFVAVEDYDFWLKAAFVNAKFLFLKEILGEYIIHSDNISSNSLLMYKNSLSLASDHVFNIQKFMRQKRQLFQLLHSRVIIEYVLSLRSENQTTQAFFVLLSRFLLSPVTVLKAMSLLKKHTKSRHVISGL